MKRGEVLSEDIKRYQQILEYVNLSGHLEEEGEDPNADPNAGPAAPAPGGDPAAMGGAPGGDPGMGGAPGGDPNAMGGAPGGDPNAMGGDPNAQGGVEGFDPQGGAGEAGEGQLRQGDAAARIHVLLSVGLDPADPGRVALAREHVLQGQGLVGGRIARKAVDVVSRGVGKEGSEGYRPLLHDVRNHAGDVRVEIDLSLVHVPEQGHGEGGLRYGPGLEEHVGIHGEVLTEPAAAGAVGIEIAV